MNNRLRMRALTFFILVTTFILAGCGSQSVDLNDMRDFSQQNNARFTKLIEVFSEKPCLRMASVENSRYTIALADGKDLEKIISNVSYDELVKNPDAVACELTEDYIFALKKALSEINSISIRKVAPAQDNHTTNESFQILFKKMEAGNFYFHFYKTPATANEQNALKESDKGFFVTDTSAVYYTEAAN